MNARYKTIGDFQSISRRTSETVSYRAKAATAWVYTAAH